MTGIPPLIGAFFIDATLIGGSRCGEAFLCLSLVGAALGPSFFGLSLIGQSILGLSLCGEAFLGSPLIDAALFGRRHAGP